MTGVNSSKHLQLKDIPSLDQDYCKIKNPKHLESVIREFIQGGVDRLHVVSDFGSTITKQRTNDGQKILATFEVLKSCKSLGPSFGDEYDELYNKYNPILKNSQMPLEEKKKNMVEWWSKIGNLLVGCPIKQREIDEISSQCKDHLRDRTHELFQTLNRLNVPVLVFSAGLGNSVESVLRQSNILFPNVKVISNFIKYNGDLADGFEEPLIHSCNKNETALEGTEYYDLVHSRDHIIVMGDSIGDAGMADGLPNSKYIIKIGFLFGNVEENLQKFMDAFDIVLVDDQTMDVPRALIEIIENKKVA